MPLDEPIHDLFTICIYTYPPLFSFMPLDESIHDTPILYFILNIAVFLFCYFVTT